MKTAISVPDAVFREAEQYARKHKKSRSELYSDALAEYMLRRNEDMITQSLDRAYETADPDAPSFVQEASARTIKRASW